MTRYKRFTALFAAIALMAVLVSCGGSIGEAAESTSPSPEPAVYYNGAYGLQITVPADWIVENISSVNLTSTPEKSSDRSALEVVSHEDSGTGLHMIELWSKEDSADKEHASLMVYIERYEDTDEETYLSAFEDVYSGEFNGYFSTLELREETVLGGQTYTRMKLRTTLPDSEEAYYEEYYIRQVMEEEYLILAVTYWADNQVSYDAAMDILTGVSLSK